MSILKQIEKYQHLLPLGYLYLVVLGILKESIVFYQLGINILKYSTIMDILMSPIAMMMSHPLIFFTCLSLAFHPYMTLKLFQNHSHKKWVRIGFGIKKNVKELTPEEAEVYGNNLVIKSVLAIYVSVFLGIAVMEGYSNSQAIKTNQQNYTHKLTLDDGSTPSVKIIDSNSAYFFCTKEGNKNIHIIPVNAIKNIEIIKNRMLDKK